VDVALHVPNERQTVDINVIVIELIDMVIIFNICHQLFNVVIFDLVDHQGVKLFHEDEEESTVWTELYIG
tara:strand:+ start:248 stop:457 length:210 start_codon:yes stop_codon:yes gene_type:complete